MGFVSFAGALTAGDCVWISTRAQGRQPQTSRQVYNRLIDISIFHPASGAYTIYFCRRPPNEVKQHTGLTGGYGTYSIHILRYIQGVLRLGGVMPAADSEYESEGSGKKVQLAAAVAV